MTFHSPPKGDRLRVLPRPFQPPVAHKTSSAWLSRLLMLRMPRTHNIQELSNTYTHPASHLHPKRWSTPAE